MRFVVKPEPVGDGYYISEDGMRVVAMHILLEDDAKVMAAALEASRERAETQ